MAFIAVSDSGIDTSKAVPETDSAKRRVFRGYFVVFDQIADTRGNFAADNKDGNERHGKDVAENLALLHGRRLIVRCSENMIPERGTDAETAVGLLEMM